LPSSPDSLLQAIIDAPDDDEPRLVWADREGGDRGELVILQCLLARREGPRAQRVKMAQRARELLARFQTETEIYARGFVEEVHLSVDRIDPVLLENHPLLRVLVIEAPSGARQDTTVEGIWTEYTRTLADQLARFPPGRIRRFEISPYVNDRTTSTGSRAFGDEMAALVASSPALAGVRELCFYGGDLGRGAFPHLARLRELTSLNGQTRLDALGCAELLRALPQIRSFGPFNNHPRLKGGELVRLLAAPEVQRLSGLNLWANELEDEDLRRIARAPFERLARLGVGHTEKITDRGLEALSESPHLHGLVELDLLTKVKGLTPAVFCRTPFAIRRMRYSATSDESVPALESAPELDWLVIDHRSKHIDRLRASIPWVNDGYAL
jgi:uncharacterized protein (TIGR02996 family)